MDGALAAELAAMVAEDQRVGAEAAPRAGGARRLTPEQIMDDGAEHAWLIASTPTGSSTCSGKYLGFWPKPSRAARPPRARVSRPES